MSIINVNKTNINDLVQSDKPVLLDFFAPWCGPCRMVSKILDELVKEEQNVIIAKVNVEEEKELAETFGIMSIPTLMVLKDQKIVNHSVGMKSKAQISQMIKEA